MTDCEKFQEQLAEMGQEALQQDPALVRHIAGCDDCTAFLTALNQLEDTFGMLPELDASDAVVEETLRTVRQAPDPEAVTLPPAGTGFPQQRQIWAAALAACVVITAGAGIVYQSRIGEFGKSSFSDVAMRVNREAQTAPTSASESEIKEFEVADYNGQRSANERPGEKKRVDEISSLDGGAFGKDNSGQLGGAAGFFAEEPAVQPEESRRYSEAFKLEREPSDLAADPDTDGRYRQEADTIVLLDEDNGRLKNILAPPSPVDSKAKVAKQDQVFANGAQDAERPPSEEVASSLEAATGDGSVVTGSISSSKLQTKGAAKEIGKSERVAGLQKALEPARDLLAEQVVGQVTRHRRSSINADKVVSVDEGAETSFGDDALELRSELNAKPVVVGGEAALNRVVKPESRRIDPLYAARQFLDKNKSLDGLIFKEPKGYWSNTYIPGDPTLRLIEARLRNWDRSQLGQQVQLERGALQAVQPFDAPEDAAMAVFLHADTASIDGPTRMRLQIGLKGAETKGGHRPAMNIGLVVDLREKPDTDAGVRIRSLVAALERLWQPGDQFSLIVAGSGGGQLVAPEQFQHGPLRVAIEQMLDPDIDRTANFMDLKDAVQLAVDSVRRGDDPNAVLGSSLVLVATGASIANDIDVLEPLAHQNAVTGVQTSVIGLGPQTDPADVDRLVAAGQGRRRMLERADQAETLINSELHAASRAVARAVRLRIRLAPGVKLIDVLGSRRLDTAQAQRVRDAENAIDQRLSRNLGIQADRGDDEDGIQIVIPNFFAGDSHVILLDVVAERAGPIADVTARYKDVVRLQNGVSQSALTVGGGNVALGPLERNVLKNLVAFEVSEQSQQTSRLLRAGQFDAAIARNIHLRDTVRGLRQMIPSWSNDAELTADEVMLNDYLSALASPAARSPDQQQYLADSLRFAAYRKLHSLAP